MRFFRAAFWALTLCLAACSVVSPYRADLRQGNFLDLATLEQVEKGMTRDQVRFVLGSPLLVDLFRPDRWDYVYLFRTGHNKMQKRQASVFFENDLVVRVEMDRATFENDSNLASAQEAADLNASNRVVEILAKPEK